MGFGAFSFKHNRKLFHKDDMKINNKKRNLIRYKYYKTDTLYADNNFYFIAHNETRCRINRIKQKHGINQRWALLVHIREDGTETYHKWARSKKDSNHIFMFIWADMLAEDSFPLAER